MTAEPHQRRHIDARLAPFAAASLLAWAVVPIDSHTRWAAYGVSIALLLAAGAFLQVSARRVWASGAGHLPAAIAFLAAVAVLRNSAGGLQSGAGILSMIPVFYIALAGSSRRVLSAVLLAVAAFYLVPIIAIGGAAYPPSQYRVALLTLTIFSIVGLAVQRLVKRVRDQAEDARRREQMLEQVGQAVRALYDSAHPRQDACRASRKLSDAQMAVLLEPDESGALVSTADDGLGLPRFVVGPGIDHPVHRVVATRRPEIVPSDGRRVIVDESAWVAAGRPEALLYQPLITDGSVFAVLVVGWPGGLAVTGSRATVIALLAHEAALAISRADQLDRLAGMAQTDPLTGLANRRAWDARLARAAREHQPFTIAMFDLDHFKAFNDSRGHLAGDRLLRETAAAWRGQLRGGDLLARLGGEEFGLLLFDCELAAAADVTDRLRELVTHGQTCSAGLAQREAQEPIEAAIARADRALYRAKAEGRDRACAAA